ncbi:hypothetical protein CLOM_g24131 [Closterium sp. NIES-68]|nr:hypothetical protein CLOM_g22255 [Closterium sp. NIES-68]GJP39790.1 hypothetical protein CLOM_g24131 [Closterium sp. NIES-68]GJP83866.1 hypothetical protein CLOP_g13967 [Closterium sp. NIES-67]
MGRRMASLRCAPCGWRRVAAAGALLVLALVALDVATDYDEDDDAGLRPRVGLLFDDLDDGDGGDDGPDDLWTLETKMSRGCAPGAKSNGCDRVDAVVVADGDLGARLHAVCAASAMSALTSLLTLAVWPSDRHMPHVRFSHLFSLTPPAPPSPPADGGVAADSGGGAASGTAAGNESAGGGSGSSGESVFIGGPERRVWVRESALPGGVWKKGLNLARRQVAVPTCPQGATPGTQGVSAAGSGAGGRADGTAFELFLSPDAVNWLGLSLADACAFERAMAACLAALHPAPAVLQLVEREDQPRLHASYGVLVDTLAAPGCSGCPAGNGSSAPDCVMRRLTMSFLKDPSKGFTLAAPNPHHTAAVADFFHPARAPAVLHATLLRAATCPFGEHVTAAAGPGLGPALSSGEGAQAVQVAGVGGGTGGDGGGGGGGGAGEEEAAVLLPFNNRVTPDQLLLCLHARVAELFSLARTRGLIAVNSSSAEARFIAAHGSAASELFRVQRAVCDSVALRPITQLKFAKYTIVEERLGVMYCGVPGLASTAWLMWLRARLGLPSPGDPQLAVDDREGGLHELALHFSEAHAVRVITRPDLLRFTFVRNPFSRLASTFHATVLSPAKSTGAASRDHWSNVLFRSVRPILDAVRDGEGQISFPSFVRLVGRLMDHSRASMDSHIAPQVDVCALSAIKYDFVGRIESLQEDARAVVERVGAAGHGDGAGHLEVFEADGTGKAADADASLARLYDKDTYEAVKGIYAMDFYVALNNITQPAPHVLHDLLESEL